MCIILKYTTTKNPQQDKNTISLLQARLSNIRHIQWWRPTDSFIPEYGFKTCISLSVSRLGLTGEERDQVTLMHHGCWRTHMHTPRHPLSHPISLPLSLTHTLVSWYPCTGLKHHRGLVLLRPCNLRAVCCLSLGKSLVSKNKLKPCILAKGLGEVKLWQSSTFHFKLSVMKYPALNCDKIDWYQEY